jgi:hypothetical protein
MKRITFIAAILLTQFVMASQNRKVLIIGMDGVRSDALQQANTPNIDALMSNSFFTYESYHRGITVSGPSWSTIMCGVEYNKHGVTDNSYANSQYNTYPYFPTRAKSCLPDLYCVQISQWAPMSDNVYNDGWDLKLLVQDGQGSQSVAAAQNQLVNPNLDAMFVYFDECDLAGHASGFSPNNPIYMNAIETVDGHIGSIMTALQNRPGYADEEWIILLSTDHGGIGNGHGGNSSQERTIWWIGSGNNASPIQMTGVTDPGSIALGNYNASVGAQSPCQADIAATALDHLLRGSNCNPTINPSWNLDGQSWLDSLYTPPALAVNELPVDNFDFIYFPNPSIDLVSLWYKNEQNEAISYEITDLNGKVVEINSNVQGLTPNKLNISFADKPKGEYFITLIIGAQRQTKKVIIE